MATITWADDNPSGTRSQTQYAYGTDASGNAKTTVTDQRGGTTTYVFDQQGKPTSVIDPNGVSRTIGYDTTAGNDPTNVASTGTPQGGTQNFVFNSDSMMTSASSPTGASDTFQSNNTDPNTKYLPTQHTNSQGVTLKYAWDAQRNLQSVTDNNGTTVTAQLTWNSCGVPQTAKDGNGNQTSYTLDGVGKCRITRVTPPAPLGATSLAYDARNRLASITDGKGQITSYTYDELDRVTRISYHDGSKVNYTYDGNGNLTSRSDTTLLSSSTHSYSYDARNRRSSEKQPNATLTYTWDPAGNRQAHRWLGHHQLRLRPRPPGQVRHHPRRQDHQLRLPQPRHQQGRLPLQEDRLPQRRVHRDQVRRGRADHQCA